MKVVINACFGGFSVSEAGVRRYCELKGIPLYVDNTGHFPTYWNVPPESRVKELPGAWASHSQEARKEYNRLYSEQTIGARDFERNDPVLVRVVEELGKAANGGFANLKVIEIPDGVEWTVEEYDGNEHIAEVHRTWG